MVKKAVAKKSGEPTKKIDGSITSANIVKGSRSRAKVNYSETQQTNRPRVKKTASKGVTKQAKTTTKRGKKKAEDKEEAKEESK